MQTENLKLNRIKDFFVLHIHILDGVLNFKLYIYVECAHKLRLNALLRSLKLLTVERNKHFRMIYFSVMFIRILKLANVCQEEIGQRIDSEACSKVSYK